MEEDSFRKRNPSNTYTPEMIAIVIKMQRLWRRNKNRKALKKQLRRMKSKSQIATQLLTSQRSYCKHIEFIIKEVVQPSRQVIDDDELHSILFSTLEEIYQMHESFLAKLEEVMSTYSHFDTKLSSVIYDELFSKDDFKMKYSNYCANYRKSNQMAKLLFVNNTGFNSLLKKAGIMQSNALESELIKPMQRLCKYELLLNNYFKNMESDHPDYFDMEVTINSVEKLVKQTNEEVEQFLLGEKFKEILYQFDDILKTVPNPERKLLFSIQDISLIDMINDRSSHYKSLYLFNDTVLLQPLSNTKPVFLKLSMVRDLSNLKYFKNLVQLIHEDKYLTIEFKKEKQKMSFLECTKKLDLSKRNGGFVSVSILGTEIRESIFKNYTVYIVEVEFSKQNIRKIYPRFKDLLRVQQAIDGRKIKLTLPSLNKQTYFSTNKSKTIEKRKLIIQQFLQKILNCKDCYQVAQIFKILNLNLKQNGRKTQQQVTITLPSEQLLHVLIDVKNSRIQELKQAITQKLGMVYNSQFQIFEIRNKVRRLMHDDEVVTQIYESQSGFNFNPFKDTITYLYTRHHYIQPDDEFTLYKNDFVRTELELSVIKSQVLKYRLEEELMITFLCLFALYINLPTEDDTKLGAFIKDICKKQYKVTKDDFRTYFGEVSKKVESEEDEMATLPFLIIRIMSNSPLYRCQQFEVNIHPKSYKPIKTYIPGLQQKVYLGIKTTHILLLTMEQKHVIQSFTMDMISIAEVHPTAIVLQIQNIGPLLRLNTQHAFQISKLFEIYKAKSLL